MKIKDLSTSDKPKKKYPYAGHRARLRDKFLKSGIDALHDYEIVELLLTLGTPFKDCKQIAKEAMREFKGLRGVLDASVDELQQVKGIGPMNPFGLKLFQAVSERYEREKAIEKIILDSPVVVAKYLRELIGREKKEHFIVLCLGPKNNLIKEGRIKVSIGTADETLVHPREVFKEAIQASSTQVIVGHNHPSGDTEPSDEDLRITKRLRQSGRVLGIEVLDHLIVSKMSFFSFKEKKLL